MVLFLLGWLMLTNINLLFNFNQGFSINQLELFYVSMFAVYLYNNYDKYIFKAIFTTLSLYYFYIFATDPIITHMPLWATILENIMVVLVLMYQFNKFNHFKSDEYNQDNVMLIFFKPKTFIDFVKSFAFSPVVSMGSIYNGHIYRLKHNKPNMCKVRCYPDTLKDYVLVDTGIKHKEVKGVDKKLMTQSAYNSKFLYTRTNCVRSQQPILDKLPKKWQTKDVWDIFPMIYLHRRLKG